MQQAAEVLNIALDHGINFLDTSACYDHSEEFIGKTVAHRRSEYILATKAGHVAEGYQGQDFEAVIDLKRATKISEVGGGFLQVARSWIWMPRSVSFEQEKRYENRQTRPPPSIP